MRQTGACGAPTSERSCHLALAIVNPPQPVRNVKAFSEHPRPLNVGANSPSGLVRRQTRPLTVAAAADTAAPTASGPVADDFTHVSTDGRWRVRLINRSDYNEVKQVVRLQTDGFHVPNGVPLLDGAFKKMFRAEVLSEMQNKLRYNPLDSFVMMVVEAADASGPVLGVVEVSYIDEKEVLKSLDPGVERFVYIASMAVESSQRRRGAASALLSAAEQAARAWGEDQAVLHVYQDNTSAIELYKKRGYEIIYGDAAWLARLAVRPRFLMRKRFRSA